MGRENRKVKRKRFDLFFPDTAETEVGPSPVRRIVVAEGTPRIVVVSVLFGDGIVVPIAASQTGPLTGGKASGIAHSSSIEIRPVIDGAVRNIDYAR